MKLLLDTHLLVWIAEGSPRLPDIVRTMVENEGNTLLFSTVSMWELAIKRSVLGDSFNVDPRMLRRELLDNEYQELTVTSEHALKILDLPAIHKDPFDRLLIAQATVEGITLLTSDGIVGRYPGPIRKV